MAGKNHSQRHRALTDMGTDVKVHNYTWDGDTDKYGDAIGFTKDTIDTRALFEQSQDPVQISGPDGEDLKVEVRIFLPDDIEVNDAEEGDKTKASQIEDLDAGIMYKVYDVWNDHNGLKMTLCRAIS